LAGIRVRVDVRGLENARRIARRVKNLGEDLTPLLSIAGAIIEASTRRRFDTETDPQGVPWPPSKAALGLARRASGKFSPGRTLFDTGGTQGSIRHEVRPTEVEVGVDARTESAKHAYVHQFGFVGTVAVPAHRRTVSQAFGVPIPARQVDVRAHGKQMTIPRRSFLGINEQDKADLTDAWQDHLRGLFQ
jgi:phage gpG-like protein